MLAFGVTFTYPVVFTIAHERLFSQVRTASLALNALMLIAIFLMVAKPGA
ncbi:MAG: hypothetical protein M3O90_08195 [Actinomycetota bacterium]|nr:hypothetical protein [Actinomycetota bacterium]